MAAHHHSGLLPEPEQSVGVDGRFATGACVMARYRDGKLRPAQVIDSRPARMSKSHAWDYYVHFIEYNRRMDGWVSGDDMELFDAFDASGMNEEEQEARKRKRKEAFHERLLEEDHEGMDAASLKEHEEVTKVKNVQRIEFGRWLIDAWYFSPFPKEYYADGVTDMLHFCEFCLSFFLRRSEMVRHYRKCSRRHPPGNEIYRGRKLAVFEVDGQREKIYSQNLCYLAKLFLDHKTLYWDVDPFLFYVLGEVDEYGFHIVGYFSKEKYSEQGYNLACILILPPFQRKGYGRFIISFSYELSKKERKVGSPEKPLSDLGALSYRSYWSHVLLAILRSTKHDSLSVMDLTRMTSIKTEDVITALQYLNFIRYYNGQHILALSPTVVEEKWAKLEKKVIARVDPERLHWAPLRVDIKRDKWALSSKLG